MRSNIRTRKPAPRTHEGGRAEYQSTNEELIRAVSTCMLFENTFYEGGDSIANRIALLCKTTAPEVIATIAIHARQNLKLRHVPLWLLVQMLHNPETDPSLFSATCQFVIKRPDEMGELLSLFTRNRVGVKKLNKLPNKLTKALADVMHNFTEYQLAKWNKDSDIKLRDIIRLAHPKPVEEWQAKLWKSVLDGTIATPDTWETALSAGADKNETFTRLLKDKKLGYMALLKNMRNMEQSGVDRKLGREALLNGAKGSWALPFRFLSAARHAPSFAGDLSDAMLLSLEEFPKLRGTTYLLVDNSPSMYYEKITAKSELHRSDAACAMAVLVREVCEDVRVFGYSDSCTEVGNVRGISLIERIQNTRSDGTMTGKAIEYAYTKGIPDRVIVITDEQSADTVHRKAAKYGSYVVNVAPYQPAMDVSSSGWIRINGWSERLVEWIQAYESENVNV